MGRQVAVVLYVAGVLPDIAERVLSHAIPGVRGVYDRHSYFDQKLMP